MLAARDEQSWLWVRALVILKKKTKKILSISSHLFSRKPVHQTCVSPSTFNLTRLSESKLPTFFWMDQKICF